MRENIYNIAPATVTYVLPSCHEQESTDELRWVETVYFFFSPQIWKEEKKRDGAR